MKYFVFGDVHGYYSLLMEELKKNGYDEENENHMLISLGDNFDRGPENYKMYEFLKKMKQKNKIILVKGNHDSNSDGVYSGSSSIFFRMVFEYFKKHNLFETAKMDLVDLSTPHHEKEKNKKLLKSRHVQKQN